ncbi:ribose 5-phosphate isomerase B [Mesobacillus selenatarsenatis]|uniref:Ribose 5-phosphate isomerase B n=1 Tax=Mesobacillus selenatarsenatis (strain DSM 18680 / JCM 14380 / FERM P-15431 / SF-1) TaxID=1321606 RepID=A0A0A8X8H1_MESS1|nr:ribose 5-phosphate isomerase B [Mesobacillus selenatarsenatis]GAM16260.1 ribose 5-phosphate isomerase B [Mesobacillus selenatarsenatis SF-1]
MRIGIGSDHNGYEFKEEIKRFIENTEHVLVDYGCDSKDPIDYPDIAFEVANAIIDGKIDRGILICGTGIGVAIAAGKYPGIRAALTHDTYSAERAQLSNNAQIITMGAQIIGVEVGKKVVEAFLKSHWTGGSERKVSKIIEKEQSFLGQLEKDATGNRCN